jgi:arginyl-tRNA synthetase
MHDVIKTAVSEALKELGFGEVAFTLEHPENLAFGDYACNAAMVVAQAARKAPREVARMLQSALEGQIEYVEKIEIAGPGFLNFTLARDFFTAEVSRISKEGEAWGRNNSWEGKKVFVEYTDPNPFKEFHIGHVFTNTVGESISRLFEASGADVKRLNYQGDVGLHVAYAIYGMQQLSIGAQSHFTARDLGKAYAYGATAYKSESNGAQETIRDINKKVYDRSDETINRLYDAGREVSLAYFETIYSMLGTKFAAYFFESECAPIGKELVLANPSVFVESDGARVFKGEEYGLHTRVFLNKEGLPTYEAKELALSKLKEERLGEYDLSVISTSNEITEYFKVLKKAMSFVYPELAEKTEHIGHGTVRLATGKMSSRTGDVISALDFIADVKEAVLAKGAQSEHERTIDEVLATDIAIGAIKFATLKSNIFGDSTFDKEQALSFEGSSGPYLQYTYARICSAVAKAASVGVSMSLNAVPELPYELERIVYRFPEVIEHALKERSPHHVATYLVELAACFNTFYANEKIADPADEFAPYKVLLAQVVAQTLKNGLWVLGIKAPTTM